MSKAALKLEVSGGGKACGDSIVENKQVRKKKKEVQAITLPTWEADFLEFTFQHQGF